MNNKKLPSLFIPHGGGPCFFMEWTRGPANTWDKMKGWLGNVVSTLPQKPSAILVISGHWEEETVHINSHPAPDLLFDYYGFPEHTYQLTYPAPGSPELAKKVQALLAKSGIKSEMELNRGYDHGVFVPLKVMFPDADIPVVQLSLQHNLDPAFHVQIGQAIESLRADNVLILGSGMSFHNMQTLMQGNDHGGHSDKFDAWLTNASTAPEKERTQLLEQWQNAPSGIESHPREEHLLPLMVVAGAAGEDKGQHVFSDRVMGATVSAYQFG